MQTIDINTVQNVHISYELGHIRDRIIAFIIDLVIMYAVYFMFLLFLISTIEQILNESAFAEKVLIQLLPIILLIFYHFFLNLIFHGQTIGKKIIGLKIIKLDGKEPDLSDFFIRSIVLLLDFILSAGVIGLVLIGASPRRQRIGDFAANTIVVKLDKDLRFNLEDIEKIETIENYEPIYPDVKCFSEADMLFIKGFLDRYSKIKNEAHETALKELVIKTSTKLGLKKMPKNKIDFLKTVIKDYIVLTR